MPDKRRAVAAPVLWCLEIYRLPKRGNELASCDDAWAWATHDLNWSSADCENSDCPYDPEKRDFPWRSSVQACLSIAISDGASDSFASNLWASLLTKNAVRQNLTSWSREELCEKLHQWLKEIGEQWRQSLNLDNLPWYAAEKAEMGAHATLLVFDTKLNQPGRRPVASYRVLAVGDNCLFHFRNGQLLNIVPRIAP